MSGAIIGNIVSTTRGYYRCRKPRDSDSTGSITGNFMGTIYGYEAIKKERLFCPDGKDFERTIELANIILALADDLFTGCIISEYDPIETPEKKQWYERYCEMKPPACNFDRQRRTWQSELKAMCKTTEENKRL